MHFRRLGITLSAVVAITVLEPKTALGTYNTPAAKEEKNSREIRAEVGILAYYERLQKQEERRLRRWQNRLKRFRRELDRLEDRNKEISRRRGQIIVEQLDAGDNKQTELRLSREEVDLRFEALQNRNRIRLLKLKIANAENKVKTHTFWLEDATVLREAALIRLRRADQQ